MRRRDIAVFVNTLALVVYSPVAAQISPGKLSAPHAGLEGITNCTSCHSLGKVIDNADCLRCHTEIGERVRQHKGLHGTLADRRCAECHKEHHGSAFALVRFDITRFDHSRMGFTLEGKHAALACRQCHSTDRVKDPAIRDRMKKGRRGSYLGLGQRCNDCHQDVHKGQLSPQCASCHNQNAWKPAPGFVHDRTAFPLIGMHIQVSCERCHGRGEQGQVALFKEIKSGTCASCHADPHAGRFAKPCEQCHTTQGWREGAAARFDHQLTRFPLKGRHAALLCTACHGRSAPSAGQRHRIVKFQLCVDCHADVHLGQFASKGSTVRCERCHTEQRFVPSRFSDADHEQSRFSLDGSHRAVPCIECHSMVSKGNALTRRYRWDQAPECTSCHENIHRNTLAGAGSPRCVQCHTTGAWKDVRYSHTQTGFALTGKHAGLACWQCHGKRDGRTAVAAWQFAGTPTKCSGCHGGDTRVNVQTITGGGIREKARR